jgi:ABC-type glycerol-3-phosphate transport system permease component
VATAKVVSSRFRKRAGGTRVAERWLVRALERAGLYCWIAFLLVLVIGPLYWLIRGAFGNYVELHSPVLHLVAPGWPPRSWPPYLDWTQFRLAFRRGAATNLLASTIVAASTTLLGTLLSAVAAYSLGRLRYPGRDALARSLLLVYLVPQELLWIPIYATMNGLHLVNTYWALILVDLSFTTPFCTWLILCYLKSVPAEIEEAALIDGSGRLQALFQVDLPLVVPGLVAAALITFSLAWGESTYAYVLQLNGRIVTLAVALSQTGDNQLMALSLIYALPVIALYLLGQRFVIEGLSTGAVKA